MFRIALSFLLLFPCFFSSAQQAGPADAADKAYNERLAKQYLAQNELFLKQLKRETGDKKQLERYLEHYRSIFAGVKELIKDGNFIEVPEITAMLSQVMSDIKAHYPAMPADLKLILVRDHNPNAFTFGDNHIFINLGLFSYLKSIDELAAILAHEMGHLHFSHPRTAVDLQFARLNGASAMVKTDGPATAQTAERAMELLRGTVYEGGRIAREYEMQADSFSYTLLRQTRYKPGAVLSALQNLEAYDSAAQPVLNTETYRKYFSWPGQEFNERWMEQEDFSSYNYSALSEKYNKDSVLSHPKIVDRVQYLITALSAAQPGVGDTVNHLANLRSLVAERYLPDMYLNEEYGELAYRTLLALQDHPDDPQYRTWLGKVFLEIYEARRDYKLNKYLDRINPKEHSESYMQFLSFMWNLKLSELELISDHYNAAG